MNGEGFRISDLVMPWTGMFFVVVVTMTVILPQLIIAEAIQSATIVTADQTCTVQSVEGPKEGDGFLGLFENSAPSAKIVCGEDEHIVKDTGLVIAHLQNPQPILCTTYQNGDVDCRRQ